MKKFVFIMMILAAALTCLLFPAEAEGLNVHIADVEEGQRLITSCLDYYDGISEKTMEFFLQKKNGTIEEYIAYSAEQVQAFSDEASAYILEFYRALEADLTKQDIRLPGCGPIAIVATTCEEVSGATGYTHGTTIYLNQNLVEQMVSSGQTTFLDEVLAHELFHCLTRSDLDFRAEMYGIIGFTVDDRELDIPKELADVIVTNPDVEHHDAHASFTINGEKTECYLLFLTDDIFEKPGDSMFRSMYTGVVTVDGNELYRTEEVVDFWDVVGRNTDYVEDPEECMAVNFSYALLWGTEGRDGNGYESPEIIYAILDYLKND